MSEFDFDNKLEVKDFQSRFYLMYKLGLLLSRIKHLTLLAFDFL